MQKITKKFTDVSCEYSFAFGELIACPSAGNEASDQRSWKFDLKNELGIYVGEADGYKRGRLIYWPHSHGTAVRYHCWPLELTDAQFLKHYNRRVSMTSGTLPFQEVANAVHDWSRDRQISEDELKWLATDIEPLRDSLAGDESDQDDSPSGSSSNVRPDPEPDPIGMHVREPRRWLKAISPSDRVLRNKAKSYFADTLDEIYLQYGEYQFMNQDFSGLAKITVIDCVLTILDRIRTIQ
jgi:hypothetical protein